ncbi:hypothetical protein AURDEDRAFT_164125 [Auricularia subglabra TFB-10046 SS5]|nr:hypothetical protein AURDEDRAFT_164125 [Auricularia subglabra TFB-10046 SS5]
MELTCKVFLAPRPPLGHPYVFIWRTPTGLLLAAVPCDCPATGECRTHRESDLLSHAHAHHARIAPLHPCTFTFEPTPGAYMNPLRDDITLHTPIPSTIPYPLAPACAFTIEDPAYVTRDTAALTYTPPHSTVARDPVDGRRVQFHFAQGFELHIMK